MQVLPCMGREGEDESIVVPPYPYGVDLGRLALAAPRCPFGTRVEYSVDLRTPEPVLRTAFQQRHCDCDFLSRCRGRTADWKSCLTRSRAAGGSIGAVLCSLNKRWMGTFGSSYLEVRDIFIRKWGKEINCARGGPKKIRARCLDVYLSREEVAPGKFPIIQTKRSRGKNPSSRTAEQTSEGISLEDRGLFIII